MILVDTVAPYLSKKRRIIRVGGVAVAKEYIELFTVYIHTYM